MSVGFGGHNGYPSLLLGQQSPNTTSGSGSGSSAPFSGAALLARLFEGGEQPGALSAALLSHGNDLRAAVSALPETQRQALEARFGAPGLAELYDLAGERDAALFRESLLSFGARQEQAGRTELAAGIYSTLTSGEGMIGQRAQARLDAVLGRGAFGGRAEFLLRRLAQESCEPTALLAMGAASAAFRLTRLAVLSRLAATPSANFLTRGFGARALASLTGFAVEATVFPMTGRVANEALGRSQDWSLRAVGRDLASSFIVLGGMKATGWLSGAAFNRLHGINPLTGQASRLAGFSGLSQQLLPQVGMLGGILLGHRVEESVGLREHVDGATTLVDSLALLLQFHVAGRLSAEAFGPRFHAWESGLDRQTELLARENRRARPPSVLASLMNTGPELASANGASVSPMDGTDPLAGELHSQMTSSGDEGNGPRLPPSEPPRSSGPGGDGGGRRIPPSSVEEARRQIEIFRSHRDNEDHDSIPVFVEALRFLRNNPEAAREALIGRSDISIPHLDEIFRATAPEGHQVLTNPNIQRVLIPNRGEIALRLARGLRAEGLTPVVLVPELEANASWVQAIRDQGGEARVITGSSIAEAYQNAYLNIPRIIAEAQAAGVQAVHPGYGYRSESPDFARALEVANLVLMGPSPRSMERAGDKDVAKQIFINAGVPVVPGTRQGYTEVGGLISELQTLGMIQNGELAFPIRLKAVAGGGGRGQRTVRSLQELRDVFPRLSAEALTGFGNGSIMAERFIARFHHVEFQVMADRFGNVIQLGERECTLQERNQKLIEIHPAAIFDRFPGLRERMAEASVRAAQAMNYTGHGTVEFMVDPATGDFFAMEVNARIQVEHRVTEAVTGFDLIREAVRVARGLPLSRSQAEVQPRGAAVEIRIKAVDPKRRDREGNATPAPGLVETFSVMNTTDFDSLASQGIYVETSVRERDRVSPRADPMIAKIIVTGDNRADAIRRATQVLERTVLRGSQGFSSDLARQLDLLRTQAAIQASYDNRFVDEWTRVGGENFAVAPHRETSLLASDTPLIHLEVGSDQPVRQGTADRHASSLSLLLHDAESALEIPLRGPVAELLRNDAALRDSVLLGSGRRGVWAQTSQDGELRQLTAFRNHRPERLLLMRQALLPTGRAPQDYAETPVVYDLRFNTENGGLQSVRLLRAGTQGIEEVMSLSPGNSMFQELNGGSEYQLFSQPGASTPVALAARLIPAGSHRGIEIRDRRGNILLSLAPEQVMESPAERVLSLFDFTGDQIPAHIRQRSEAQIRELIGQMAQAPRDSRARTAFVAALGETPVSLVRRLLRLMGESRNPQDLLLLDEILAHREISGYSRRHRFDSYEPIDANASLVRFTQTGPDGQATPRLQIRLQAEPGSEAGAWVRRGLQLLDAARSEHPEARDSVLQIITRDFNPAQLDEIQNALNFSDQIRAAQQGDESTPRPALDLKRLTVVVDRPGGYPDYYTFRRAEAASGERNGAYAEDLRFRHLHPMVAHMIELWRMQGFNFTRDDAHSDRFTHIYFAANRKTAGLEAGQDQRLIGKAVIPEAEVQRTGQNEEIRIPQVEAAFERLLNSAHDALEAREGRRPFWNRLELFVQPILNVSDAQVAAYAERLSERYQDRLRGLGLEKVVVKAWLRDPRMPEGHRNILVRITNPTGYRFEPQIDNIVRARVQAEDGSVSTREVLLSNGTFERWREVRSRYDESFVVSQGEWAPADIPIKSATPAELREAQARARGAVWVYRIPELISEVAERFRNAIGLGTPRPAGSERPPSSETPNASSFEELELSGGVRDERTGMLDPNQGFLVPAVDAEGRPRPEGGNQAGVVIGVQTDHLGVGIPVRRVVIMGDLTHASRGSLSANECARINAAIRYAAEHRLPIDWFTASSGAEIHERRGVEGLDATATTVREIVRNAHNLGVRMNIVVSDVNIGAQSYWNSLATIVQDTGGILVMIPRGSMALTGPDAWTAAMLRDLHSEDLPAAARRFYPEGLQSLAGYRDIHGPNREAMAFAPDLAAAVDILLRHHYFTYALNGEIVSQRVLGYQDPSDRDITQQTSSPGRTVGDEIAAILSGRSGNREAILDALQDEGSPAPVSFWLDAQGIRHQPDGNGLMRQRPTTLVREMQIGGRPTMVIFPALGPLTPADSNIIGQAIEKANQRLPILLIGSLTGFNGDPRSMENRQLEGGARIAQAIVRHRGPVTVVNMGYIVGGTYVVVSKQLNPNLRMLALEGSHAQVIGGPSAAKVVFRSRIRVTADRDPRVVAARESLAQAAASDRGRLETEYQNVRRAVIQEIEQSQAAAFDAVHSVQRAQQVGSVDEVIAPAQLREAVIRHREEALGQYRRQLDAEAEDAARSRVDAVTRLPEGLAVESLIDSLERVYGPERARALARTWGEGLNHFANSDPEPGNNGGSSGGGTEGSGSAAPP